MPGTIAQINNMKGYLALIAKIRRDPTRHRRYVKDEVLEEIGFPDLGPLIEALKQKVREAKPHEANNPYYVDKLIQQATLQ